MEFLFEFLAEALLQMLFEAVAELGCRSLRFTFERQRYPLLSALGILLSGAVAGGVSIWPFPHSFIANPAYRLVNLLVTPLIAGALMALIGKFRERHGQFLVALDRFNYAFVFAFSMALVRLIFAK
jgi:hypothetical protein